MYLLFGKVLHRQKQYMGSGIFKLPKRHLES